MKALIVSLHDVSLQNFAACREILRDLAEARIEATSLLVIPDHHHRGHFLTSPAFCEWLQEMKKAGHEIVTHGYFHQRERNARESVRDKTMTRFYTEGEGEFYDIAEADALRKLERAQSEFAQLNIHPVGFIAPAWLLSEAGERAARKCGFLYTTTLGEIRSFRVPQSAFGLAHSSQSLVYSVRSGWRRACSLIWNPWLARRLTKNPVVRLGIHPPDWQHASIRNQILGLIRILVASRQPVTYASYLSSLPS